MIKQMNNNIPQGYKQSPLGVIPQDWEVRRLGEVCDKISSGKNKQRIDSGVYPVYGSTGQIGFCNRYIYNSPAILVARVGANAGQINVVCGEYDVSDNTLIITPQSDYYFSFAYNQLDYYNLNKLVFGSGQPLITAGQLKALQFVLPPLAEQERIAEVLGTWDVAIEKQGALVDALTRRKRALMQQLLTARTRLSGFSEPWQNKQLKDVYQSESTFSFSRDNMTTDTQLLSYVHYGDIHNLGIKNFIDLKQDTLPYIFNGLISNEKLEMPNFPFLHNGDLLITDASEDRDGIGKTLEIIDCNDKKIIAGLHTIALRPKTNLDVVVGFSRFIFKNHISANLLKRLSQGTKVYAISYNLIRKIPLLLPPLEEQKEIINILTTADKEIELATTKLNSLRTQKRALMQQLLTGKKRLRIWHNK